MSKEENIPKAAAIYNFWSGFGLDTYEENSVFDIDGVPDFPYLTYEFSSSSFGTSIPLSCSLWYRSTSWVAINAKVKEISETIGDGGVILHCDGGYIWLTRSSPFNLNMGDSSDDMVKRAVINVNAEFFTTN